MDSKAIIKSIEEFLASADEKVLAEVNAAASVKFDGDISLEEYLDGFSSEYFYTYHPVPNTYTDSDKLLATGGQYSELMSFESASSNYEESDLVMSSKTKSEDKECVTKMIKLAA